MQKLLATLLLCLFSLPSMATILLPDDYEINEIFFKVEERRAEGRTKYFFSQCAGDIEEHECIDVFNKAGYSKAELNAIEEDEATLSGLFLTAEIVTGGIIWKRLMKFSLGHATRGVARVTGWKEGVANGSVALFITAPVNLGVTFYIMSKLNAALEFIDPWDRYKRSEVVDTDEYVTAADGKETIHPVGYDFRETYEVLRDLLYSIDD